MSALDLTIACLRCATTIKIPATDRHSVLELLVDYGWQATKDGAFCHLHKLQAARA